MVPNSRIREYLQRSAGRDDTPRVVHAAHTITRPWPGLGAGGWTAALVRAGRAPVVAERTPTAAPRIYDLAVARREEQERTK
jgi:hypothetical protein